MNRMSEEGAGKGWGRLSACVCLLGVLAAVGAGGGVVLAGRVWVLLLAGVGLCLAAFSGKVVGWRSVAVWAAFAGAGALAFLPAGCVPDGGIRARVPEGLAEGGLWALQPWVSWEAWGGWLAGWGVFGAVAASGLDDVWRRRLLLFFVMGVGGLALGALACHHADYRPGFWPEPVLGDSAFGFFPNNNQSALVFFLGLWLGGCLFLDAVWRRQGWVALGCAGAAAVSTYAALQTTSKAPFVLALGSLGLVAALALWHGGRRWWGRVFVGGSVGLVLLLLVASTDFEPAREFREFLQARVSAEGRLLLQRDALRLSFVAPLTGVGLGQFEDVFPMWREASAVVLKPVRHPEGDWVWLAAEMGWPIFLGVGALGLMLLGWNRPGRIGRWCWHEVGVWVACVCMVVQGLWDVGWHRMGTALCGAFLFGLMAVHWPERGRGARGGVVAIGGLLCVLGVLWLSSTFAARPAVPDSQRYGRAVARLESAWERREWEALEEAAHEAQAYRPLAWRVHLLRASAALARLRIAEAETSFARVRDLEGVLLEPVVQEALLWMAVSSERSVAAWQEVFRRGGVAAAGHPGGHGLQNWLSAIGPRPTIQTGLLLAAHGAGVPMETYLPFAMQEARLAFQEALAHQEHHDAP